MEDLKPCPFCGSEGELEQFKWSDSIREAIKGLTMDYRIRCSKCGVRTTWRSKAAAIKAWNRRAK